MVYQDNPLLALMSKAENMVGDVTKLPIKTGIPQGRSSDFGTAQANKTSTKLNAFFLTRDKDYSLASIDNETMEASKGNAAAFMEAATTEIDGAIESATRSLAIAMYGSGSGSIGSVDAAATGTVFTLADAESVTNFEVGMQLVYSTTDGGGVIKSGRVQIVGVDRDNGDLTTEPLTAIDGGAGVAAGDFVFVEGDYDSKVKGLQAWLPNVAPTTGDNFFSVDRSVDPTRLAGVRYDGSAEPIEEALISAASRVAREGAKPDYCFLSYSKFADLEKALGSKVNYINSQANADIGFRGMEIHGPRGVIKVIADQNCPDNRAFMLTMKSWKLNSLGKAPKILDSDGLKMLRESSADAVEVRVGYYAQVSCNAPGHNVNVKLS